MTLEFEDPTDFLAYDDHTGGSAVSDSLLCEAPSTAAMYMFSQDIPVQGLPSADMLEALANTMREEITARLPAITAERILKMHLLWKHTLEGYRTPGATSGPGSDSQYDGGNSSTPFGSSESERTGRDGEDLSEW